MLIRTTALITPAVTALPTLYDNSTDLIPDIEDYVNRLSKRSVGNGMQLRIQCLGASVVNGAGSTTGNGFRYPLRNQLLATGNPVNFIGSQTSGTMVDSEVSIDSMVLYARFLDC